MSEISLFKSLVFLSHVFFPLPFLKSPCSALIRNFPLGCLCLEYLYSIILPSSSQTWLSFVYPVALYWSFNLSFSLLIKLLFSFSGGRRSQGFFQPHLTWFLDFLQCFSTFDTVAPRSGIQPAPSVKTHRSLSPREIQGDNSLHRPRSSWRRTSRLCPASHPHGWPEAKVSAPLFLGHLLPCQGPYSWPAAPGRRPDRLQVESAEAGVRVTWRSAVPLALQSPGVSGKLHRRCRSGPSTPATLLRPISIFLPRFRAIWPMAPLAHTPKAAEPRGGFLAGRDPCRPARTKEVF